jgi:hypothetical protein
MIGKANTTNKDDGYEESESEYCDEYESEEDSS